MVKRIVAAYVLFLLIMGSAFGASAQQTPPDQQRSGVTITPAMQELKLEAGQAESASSFTVQNNSDKPATFELTTVDMGTLDETGGLIFSGLPQDYQKKYGLAEWVELPATKIDVAPRKVVDVNFKIKNQDSLAPGGHYGAIMVRQITSQTGNNQVPITAQASSILFLLKRGGEIYKLSLQEIKSDHSVWKLPTKVELPFKNEGNVHVVPRGIIRIKNTGGDVIAKAVINNDSATILPERTRTLQYGVEGLPKVVWPGRYTIEVDYRYDGQENFTRISQTFYTANLKVLLTIIVTVIFTMFLIFRFRKPLKKALLQIVKSVKKIVRKIARK